MAGNGDGLEQMGCLGRNLPLQIILCCLGVLEKNHSGCMEVCACPSLLCFVSEQRILEFWRPCVLLCVLLCNTRCNTNIALNGIESVFTRISQQHMLTMTLWS